jgi:hypothetical protein
LHDEPGERSVIPLRPRSLVAAAAAVACVVGIVGRARVVAVAPGAARLYGAVGLPLPTAGLDFRLVTAEMVRAGSEAALVVQGEIANMSADEKAVPAIELTVRNPAGQPFYTWTTEPARRTLAPSETASFRARLAAPPPEGTQVLVRFASALARGAP